jgi:hypothetical protein
MRGGGIGDGSHKSAVRYIPRKFLSRIYDALKLNITCSMFNSVRVRKSSPSPSLSPPTLPLPSPPLVLALLLHFSRAKMKKLAILVYHLDTPEPPSPSLSPSPCLSLSLAPSSLAPSRVALPSLAPLALPPLALPVSCSISLTLSSSPSPSPSLLVAPQKLKRRTRAHNIPGGIKHLLSDSKRRHRISVRSVTQPPSSTSQPFSHRSHPRFARLRHKAANPASQQTFASSAPASESQCPHSQSQPQSPSPINVTFPRRLPELPRKQISSEVLASIGFTPEVPSQYIRDQMERLGPMYAFVYFNTPRIPY